MQSKKRFLFLLSFICVASLLGCASPKFSTNLKQHRCYSPGKYKRVGFFGVRSHLTQQAQFNLIVAAGAEKPEGVSSVNHAIIQTFGDCKSLELIDLTLVGWDLSAPEIADLVEHYRLDAILIGELDSFVEIGSIFPFAIYSARARVPIRLIDARTKQVAWSAFLEVGGPYSDPREKLKRICVELLAELGME
jgi:hypothetical protein